MVKVTVKTVETLPQRGPLVALGFWLCLIVSAALYALCALSPRIVEWTSLQHRSVENQVELIGLQNQIKHLERVAAAIETDPEFAARLARSEFGGVARSGEQIPLPPALDYDPRVPREIKRPQVAGLPWYLPLLQRITDDGELRLRALGAAACLTLFAFLFLQERSLGILRMPARLANRVASRYVMAEDSPQIRYPRR